MSQQTSSLDAFLAPPAGAGLHAVAPTRILETVIVRFLARVIHADSHIDPAEVQLLTDIGTQLGLGGDEAKRILDDELRQQSDVKRLATQLPDRIQRREVYAMGCLVAFADGGVPDSEKKILDDFAGAADISRDDAAEILDAIVEASRSK